MKYIFVTGGVVSGLGKVKNHDFKWESMEPAVST